MSAMGTAILGLSGAVTILFNAYKRAQEARLRDAAEHKETLKEIYEMLERRKR